MTFGLRALLDLTSPPTRHKQCLVNWTFSRRRPGPLWLSLGATSWVKSGCSEGAISSKAAASARFSRAAPSWPRCHGAGRCRTARLAPVPHDRGRARSAWTSPGNNSARPLPAAERDARVPARAFGYARPRTLHRGAAMGDWDERQGPVDHLALMREVVPALGARPAPRSPCLRHVVVLSDRADADSVGWREMLEGGRRVSDDTLRGRASQVDPEQSAFILYTSGTTGFPKGAVHNHRMIRNTWDHGDRMGITVNDVILMYLPLFHAFGFIEGPLMSMIRGAREVLTETFDAGHCLDLIASEKATIIHGFDTHYKELLEAQEGRPRDVSSVRTGICGTGMSSAIPIARRARQTFGNLMTGFGMSEVGIGVTFSFLDSTEEQCVEANGYPGAGYELRIVDPATGADQPASVPGEILVRGYMVTRGYYKRPEETARAIDAGGWVHTGDMGVMRPDGHMRFLGRYKDMLKIGGENVDPMEVEAFLMSHPAIAAAAVVGLPDARLAEVAVAFVQRLSGATLTERDVIEHCRGRVASFKIPRYVVFVDEFPMTSTGKVQKVKLRERARNQWP